MLSNLKIGGAIALALLIAGMAFRIHQLTGWQERVRQSLETEAALPGMGKGDVFDAIVQLGQQRRAYVQLKNDVELQAARDAKLKADAAAASARDAGRVKGAGQVVDQLERSSRTLGDPCTFSPAAIGQWK